MTLGLASSMRTSFGESKAAEHHAMHVRSRAQPQRSPPLLREPSAYK